MKRLLKIIAIAAGLLVLIVLLLFWWAYRATQRPVVWYEEILDTSPQATETAGDELEKRALALLSDVKRPRDRWEAIFRDDEINGWLVADLPEKHPDALPEGISQPRVIIEPGGGRLACRYETEHFSTVLNMDTSVYLTEEPNTVAVRVRNVRAGAMPLPLKQFFESATAAVQSQGVGIRWTEQEGDPVALVTISPRYRGVPGRLQLETLVLRDGEVYLAGHTVP